MPPALKENVWVCQALASAGAEDFAADCQVLPFHFTGELPLRVLPPMFNRYEEAMTFGTHVDNAIRTVPGTGGMRIRADVSSTLFLSDPDEYEGGELVIA